MTDKEILKGYQEQFNTGGLLSEGHVLVLMGYARGDARKIIKDMLPGADDIELMLIEEEKSWNQNYCRGYRQGAEMVINWIKRLIRCR